MELSVTDSYRGSMCLPEFGSKNDFRNLLRELQIREAVTSDFLDKLQLNTMIPQVELAASGQSSSAVLGELRSSWEEAGLPRQPEFSNLEALKRAAAIESNPILVSMLHVQLALLGSPGQSSAGFEQPQVSSGGAQSGPASVSSQQTPELPEPANDLERFIGKALGVCLQNSAEGAEMLDFALSHPSKPLRPAYVEAAEAIIGARPDVYKYTPEEHCLLEALEKSNEASTGAARSIWKDKIEFLLQECSPDEIGMTLREQAQSWLSQPGGSV